MEHFVHDQIFETFSSIYSFLFSMTGLSIFDWIPPKKGAPKPSPMSNEDLKPLVLEADTTNDQSQSPLFAILPGEIRDQIWAYALTDYEDKTAIYDDKTCYKRPNYLAPRRTDTELLRACKRIYQEAWFLPWANAEHAFYLAWHSRTPPRTTSLTVMQRALNALAASHIEPSIEHVRVFAQLCSLEPGSQLSSILNMKSFHPKVITITIRHTDWVRTLKVQTPYLISCICQWSWESDAALNVASGWVRDCRFPNSLKELRVAFESLERKKEHIDHIAAQAIERWNFEKEDGTIMLAGGCEPEIMRWTGSSTWEGSRWIRDETRPNELDYYVSTVTWKPGKTVETAEERPISSRRRFLTLDGPGLPKLHVDVSSVRIGRLRHLGIPVDAPAEEVLAALNEVESESDPDSYLSEDEDMEEDEEYEDEDLEDYEEMDEESRERGTG